jgi:hypothetical protein
MQAAAVVEDDSSPRISRVGAVSKLTTKESRPWECFQERLFVNGVA